MKSISPTKKLSPQDGLPPAPTNDELAALHALHPAPKARLLARIVQGSKDLVDGTFRVGPKHTLHAVKDKPVQYGAMLAGVGALGAGCMAVGVNPEPYTLSISAAACVWSAWAAIPDIRAAKGSDRLRLIGANLLWPAAMAGATAAGGMVVGHGGAHNGAHAALPTGADIANAGVQTIVIGADAPTIVQTVMDAPKTEGKKRGFLKWLLRKD